MNLNILPPDVLREIASCLPIKEVLKLRETCKYINTSLSPNKFWLDLLNRDFHSDYVYTRIIDGLDSNNANNSYKLLYLKREEERRHMRSRGREGSTRTFGPK